MPGRVVDFLDMAKRKGSRKKLPLFVNYKTYWIKYVLPFMPYMSIVFCALFQDFFVMLQLFRYCKFDKVVCALVPKFFYAFLCAFCKSAINTLKLVIISIDCAPCCFCCLTFHAPYLSFFTCHHYNVLCLMSQEKYFSSYIKDFYILCLMHILQAKLCFVPYILYIMSIVFVPYIYYNTSIK